MIYWILIIIKLLVQAPPTAKLMVCRHTKAAIVIDGDLKEWKHAQPVVISGALKNIENKISACALWDDKNLYLSFKVSDKNLQASQTVKDHPQLWLDDMVEFLIDTKNRKDSCWGVDDLIYHINLFGQKKDDRGDANCKSNSQWDGQARYVVKLNGTLNDSTDTDTGYIIELAISWNEVNIKPLPGAKLGFNFANGDYGKLFDWVGASPMRSPYQFGDLVLKK